jgi:hypothetical protein
MDTAPLLDSQYLHIFAQFWSFTGISFLSPGDQTFTLFLSSPYVESWGHVFYVFHCRAGTAGLACIRPKAWNRRVREPLPV